MKCVWVLQEELDPVVEESEETIMKCVKLYPPKTIPFQDTSISSSFSTPKVTNNLLVVIVMCNG